MKSANVWIASALTPLLVPLAPQMVWSQGIERVANPITGAGHTKRALSVQANAAANRAQCLLGAIQGSVRECPNDCMIPYNLQTDSNSDICTLSSAAGWQCRWPTQWVGVSETCSSLFGSGWTGNATVQYEYEMRNCGSSMVRLGSPRRITDTSQCRRVDTENDTFACPSQGQALPSGRGVYGDDVLARWRTYTSRAIVWEGGSLSVRREVTRQVTTDGAITELNATPWGLVSDSCRECQPTSDTSSQSCGGGQSGSISLRRDYSCPGGWGGWYETSRQCCSPSSESSFMPCPGGMIGGISYRRDYSCSGGSGSWGGWYETSRSCTPPCTPTSESTSGACPSGFNGSINYRRDLSCPSNSWGNWYETGRSCSPAMRQCCWTEWVCNRCNSSNDGGYDARTVCQNLPVNQACPGDTPMPGGGGGGDGGGRHVSVGGDRCSGWDC